MVRRLSATWRLYLALAGSGAAMVGAMLYGWHTGERMSLRYLPLIDAAVQIQLEATTAHLWFEEILSGDRHESMQDVWRHLDSADGYARAMLDGRRSAEGTIVPLEDPRLRQEIEEVRRKLAQFNGITRERWDARRTSAAGTGIDQRYDGVFGEFISLAHGVETRVQREIEGDIALFRRIQFSLIVGAALLAVLAGLVIARYVEQRRRTERRLQRSEEELRLTFESTPIAMAVLDGSGRFVRVNPACCEMLGYDRDELCRLRLEDITHPDDASRSTHLVEELIGGGAHARRTTSRYLRRDGAILHGLIHARRMIGVGSAPIVVGQILDRTKEVHAEEEARQQRERLAHVARVTTMGEMATGIAHEINQPLAAISTFAQACQRLIGAEKIDSGELTETLGQVSAQARRAGEVIRRLRTFVSKRDSERERVVVNDLIEEAVELVRTDVGLHDLQIDLQLADDLPEAIVDSVQIQQVILNLVRNGLEAMQEMGAKKGILTLQTTPAEGEIEIRVADQGPGLAPQVVERLFDPFLTTKASGMGMGLSISPSIVTAHGGRIWHTSNEGGGTTFHVALPADIGSDAARP
jgi:PAS domain S-box-containing protein